MTGTEPHATGSALRGTAGRGPNWPRDRGPRAGHAGAARRCTKRHRRLWAQPGPWAVHGPRELRVDVCTSRHRRPRDPLGTAGRERAGGAARFGAGATRRRMHTSGTAIFGICLVYTTYILCICRPHQYAWNIRGISNFPWIYHGYPTECI